MSDGNQGHVPDESAQPVRRGRTPLRLRQPGTGLNPGSGTVKVRVPGQGSDIPAVPAGETPADAYRIPPEINVTTPLEVRHPASDEIKAGGDMGAMDRSAEGAGAHNVESDLQQSLAQAPEPLREEDLDVLPPELAHLKERMVEANAHYGLVYSQAQFVINDARTLRERAKTLEAINGGLVTQVKDLEVQRANNTYYKKAEELTAQLNISESARAVQAQDSAKEIANTRRKGWRNAAITGLAGILLAGTAAVGTYFASRADPELGKRLDSQTRQIELLTAQRNQNEREIQAAQNAYKELLDGDYRKEVGKSTTLQATVDVQNATLARKAGVETENEGLRKANTTLAEDNRRYLDKAADLATENDALVKERDALKAKYDSEQTRANKAEQNYADAQKQVKAGEEESARLSAQVSKLELEVKTSKVNAGSQTNNTNNSGTQVQPAQPAPVQPAQAQPKQDDQNKYVWSYVMEHYGKDRKQTGESSLIALTKKGDYVVLDGKTHEVRTGKDNKPLVFANYKAAGEGIQKFVDDAAILPVYPNGDRQIFRSTWYNPLSKNGVPLPVEIGRAWEHANRTSYAIGPTIDAITGTLNIVLVEGNLRNTIPTNALKHATENVPVVRKVTRGLDKFTQGTAAACIGGADFNQSGADALVGNEAESWYRTGPLGWFNHSYSDKDNFAYGNGYKGSAIDYACQIALDTWETAMKAANLGLIYKAPEMLQREDKKPIPTTKKETPPGPGGH